MPFLFLPLLTSLQPRAAPYCDKGDALIFLHRDRTCLFFAGRDAAGHWPGLRARSREQPWCNPCSVCATPPAVHLQTGHAGDLYLKRSLSDFAIVPFHSSIAWISNLLSLHVWNRQLSKHFCAQPVLWAKRFAF